MDTSRQCIQWGVWKPLKLMENRWRRQMTLSHNQHNTQLSHIAATVLPRGCQKHIQTFKKFYLLFANFTWRMKVETYSVWARPKGHVTQQYSNDRSEQNDEWKQHWFHVDWISSDSPWIHQSTTGKAKEKRPLKAEGRWTAPLLPKVILTGCGVCSSLVPCHIFPRSLRSKTIDSSLITWLVFNVWIWFYLHECHCQQVQDQGTTNN